MCSSYESLCGMNYRFVTEDGDPVELLNSKSDICKCQNNVTCSSDWFNLTNAIVQTLLTGNDLQLEARITFCQLPTNQEPCKFGDPVLTTKGHGQFSFELASPMNCKCNRPLFAQSAWRVGLYDYITYGCGQPRCKRRDIRFCARVTYHGPGDYRDTYLCRCRQNESCGGDLPNQVVKEVSHTCLPQKNWESDENNLNWHSFLSK
ncbi:uncharacterized protein LOC128222867 [Mya arenaria]|uniref:uncharacterized protein LOC128222867 n=1 Tax=Mya arenaria TaxID=6604 RepID=UPI0022E94542|nr:uncharacterized protein LOC128222867 [Mya arenaria]